MFEGEPRSCILALNTTKNDGQGVGARFGEQPKIILVLALAFPSVAGIGVVKRDHLNSPAVVEPGSQLVVPERNFSRAEIVQIALGVASVLVSGVAVVLAARK